jgi:hypothetical protein
MKHRFYLFLLENVETFSDFVAFQAVSKLAI